MVSWDEPYIGDESIRRPPAAKNARMTAAHSSLSSRSSPTLNVIQLPSPTTGSRSPEDGMGRVSGSTCASARRGRSSEEAAAAVTPLNMARRLRVVFASILSPTWPRPNRFGALGPDGGTEGIQKRAQLIEVGSQHCRALGALGEAEG